MSEPLGAGGVSESWLSQKRNVKRIFKKFRHAKVEYSQLAPRSLGKLTEAQVANRALWESLATYLVREYKIHAGEFKGKALKFINVLNYLRSAMRITESRLRTTAGSALREFFSCLDKNSLSNDAIWFRGIKKNILRETFERVKVTGEPIDGSEVPIYLEDIVAINRAYCLEGSSAAVGAHREPRTQCACTRPLPAPRIPAIPAVQRASLRWALVGNPPGGPPSPPGSRWTA